MARAIPVEETTRINCEGREDGTSQCELKTVGDNAPLEFDGITHIEIEDSVIRDQDVTGNQAEFQFGEPTNCEVGEADEGLKLQCNPGL